MLLQKRLHLILYNIVGIVFCSNHVYATSCQVYPSEYAYHHRSVASVESKSVNCRRYARNLDPNVFTHQYIHCDGSHHQLTDSNFGQEQYQYTDYYWWSAGSSEQLLFIFPTRVSLTTITLHYYSDNYRGLPRLRFYAVPDDFYVWLGPTTLSDPTYVEVASVLSGGEPAGCRNISIDVNFNTTKVLMYKFNSSFVFSVSEVEFVMCKGITTSTTPTSEIPTSSTGKTDKTTMLPEDLTTATTLLMVPATTNSHTKSMRTPSSFTTDPMSVVFQSKSVTEIIAIGVSIALLLVLSTILSVPLLVWSYKRRSAKQKLYTDSSYSTLSRGFGQQIQPPSIQHNSAELYEQIHLSPSTGQTEYISKNESANINTLSQTWQNSHPTYSTAGDNRAEHSSALITANRATMSQLSSQKTCKSTCEQPTYAAIDKSKKSKQTKKEDPKCKSAEKGLPASPYRNEVPSASMQEKKEKAEKETIPSHAVEKLYAAVKKKPKVVSQKMKRRYHQYHHTQLKSCTQLLRKSQKVI